MSDWVLELLRQGGLTLVAGIAMFVAWRKDRLCCALYDRLERKSEKFLEQLLALERELNETIAALVDAIERRRKTDEKRGGGGED